MKVIIRGVKISKMLGLSEPILIDSKPVYDSVFAI